jgi:hypothetical protein
MQRFKVTTNVAKIDGASGAIITKDVVNTTSLCDRSEGNDGYEYRLNADAAERTVDLAELGPLTYLRVEARWAESDSASGIVEGAPAPLEFQIGGATGVWFSTSALQMEGESFIPTGLKIRNAHASGKAIRARIVAAGG